MGTVVVPIPQTRNWQSDVLEHLLWPAANPVSLVLESSLLTNHCATLHLDRVQDKCSKEDSPENSRGGGGGGDDSKQDKSMRAWRRALWKGPKGQGPVVGQQTFLPPPGFASLLLLDPGRIATPGLWARETCAGSALGRVCPFVWRFQGHKRTPSLSLRPRVIE